MVPTLDWSDAAACRDDPRYTAPQPRGPAGARLQADLLAKCAGCPVLDQCRDWSARYRWSSIVVAGWWAPVTHHARPPWSAATAA